MSPLVHFLAWQVGLASPITRTTIPERDCLAKHASGRSRVAEIGVWQGVTTCRLLSVMHDAGTLYAVDPYLPGRLGICFAQKIAQKTVRPYARGRMRWLRMRSVEAAAELSRTTSERFDFLFLDGDHSYDGLKRDWESWRPIIALHGIVAIHDSRVTPARAIHGAGSVRFTEDVIVRDPQFQVIDEIDSLTVLQRVRL